jgi:uncharacterized membrane protein YhaH (DUF805 family)
LGRFGDWAVNNATRAAHQAPHPATLRLPAAFDYPLAGILGRTAIGLGLFAIGGAMLMQSGLLWRLGAICFGTLGVIVTISNLRALLDPERRKIVLDDEGVEIRYGNSRRRYRFVDYSDYRISRIGLRRFLTALPVDLERSLGARAERVRVTLYDRPAFLAPMPMLGGGAPGSLLEWQATLNELRRLAIAAARLAGAFERAARDESADEARRAAVWRTRELAGTKPSRLTRSAYARGGILLALAFFALLLGPLGLAAALKSTGIMTCGSSDTFACSPLLLQGVMIGGPVLAVLFFIFVDAHMMVKRAHDLDEDLPYWKAALESLNRRSALKQRLTAEEGTHGANQFGPPPN